MIYVSRILKFANLANSEQRNTKVEYPAFVAMKKTSEATYMPPRQTCMTSSKEDLPE